MPDVRKSVRAERPTHDARFGHVVCQSLTVKGPDSKAEVHVEATATGTGVWVGDPGAGKPYVAIVATPDGGTSVEVGCNDGGAPLAIFVEPDGTPRLQLAASAAGGGQIESVDLRTLIPGQASSAQSGASGPSEPAPTAPGGGGVSAEPAPPPSTGLAVPAAKPFPGGSS